MFHPSAEPAPAPVEVSAAAAASLIHTARELGLSGWDFPVWPNVSLAEMPQPGSLAPVTSEIAARLRTDGFCVVRLSANVADQPEPIAAGAATLLASGFGMPFRIYRNNPGHWRSLGADPDRPANRSEGVGLQLPHTDFCNAEQPPDTVCLLCLRPDPLGGGASLVARIAGIEDALAPADLEALSRPVYRDGQVSNLSGIGDDANPFAVISQAPHARFRYRFVGHLLESAPEGRAREAVRALVAALSQRTFTIPLAAGDLLLVNQHLAVHGRAALGAEQDNLPMAARRRLLLSFLRTGSTPAPG
jgi:hypothetical protein